MTSSPYSLLIYICASDSGEDIPTSEKRDPDWREDIPTSGKRALDLRGIIPTSEKHDPVWREDIPTSEERALDLRGEIPTSGKCDPVWREDLLTSGKRDLDLRHIIPTWGWRVPDSGQVFQSHRRPPFILEHISLDGDCSHHGGDDGNKYLEYLLHC